MAHASSTRPANYGKPKPPSKENQGQGNDRFEEWLSYGWSEKSTKDDLGFAADFS